MDLPAFAQQTTPERFRFFLDVPPFPAGQCITNVDQLREWIRTTGLTIHASRALVQATYGTMDEATVEDRTAPRFMLDDAGRFLGVAVWMPALQGWTIGGQPGELRTITRVKSTVALDLAARPMAGWKLADGTAPGIANLSGTVAVTGGGGGTIPSQWFTGTAPNWDRYTVAYTG
jgi:hypothetical protein